MRTIDAPTVANVGRSIGGGSVIGLRALCNGFLIGWRLLQWADPAVWKHNSTLRSIGCVCNDREVSDAVRLPIEVSQSNKHHERDENMASSPGGDCWARVMSEAEQPSNGPRATNCHEIGNGST